MYAKPSVSRRVKGQILNEACGRARRAPPAAGRRRLSSGRDSERTASTRTGVRAAAAAAATGPVAAKGSRCCCCCSSSARSTGLGAGCRWRLLRFGTAASCFVSAPVARSRTNGVRLDKSSVSCFQMRPVRFPATYVSASEGS